MNKTVKQYLKKIPPLRRAAIMARVKNVKRLEKEIELFYPEVKRD